MIQHIAIWIVTAAFLILMAILDLKHKKMPSIIPTAAILFLVCVNLILNPAVLWYGVAAFVFAWFLYEIDFFRGVADIKAMVIIGLLIRSPIQFFAFMLLVVCVGLAYQVLVIKLIHGDSIKKLSDLFKIREEAPFVPALTIVFLVLLVISYVR